jgi:hypothetical protein
LHASPSLTCISAVSFTALKNKIHDISEFDLDMFQTLKYYYNPGEQIVNDTKSLAKAIELLHVKANEVRLHLEWCEYGDANADNADEL